MCIWNSGTQIASSEKAKNIVSCTCQFFISCIFFFFLLLVLQIVNLHDSSSPACRLLLLLLLVLQIDSRFLSSLQNPILRIRSFSLDISMLQKAQPLCTLKDIRYLKVVWFLCCCSSSFRATFYRFGYDMGP